MKMSEVVTWPQALVAGIFIVVVLGIPQIITLVKALRIEGSAQQINKQVHNNGGSSMKDTVDKTYKLAKEAADAASTTAEGLADLKTAFENHIADEQDRRMKRRFRRG